MSFPRNTVPRDPALWPVCTKCFYAQAGNVQQCAECGGLVATSPKALVIERLKTGEFLIGSIIAFVLSLLLFFGAEQSVYPIANEVARMFVAPQQLHKSSTTLWSAEPGLRFDDPQKTPFAWEIHSLAIAPGANAPASGTQIAFTVRSPEAIHAAHLITGKAIPEREIQYRSDFMNAADASPEIYRSVSEWKGAVTTAFQDAGIDLSDPMKRSHHDAIHAFADAVLANPSNVHSAGIMLKDSQSQESYPLVIGGGSGPVFFDIRDTRMGWAIITPIAALIIAVPLLLGAIFAGIHRIVWADYLRDLRGEFLQGDSEVD